MVFAAMADIGADWVIFIAFSAVIGSVVFFQIESDGLLHILVMALLCLGVTTFVVHLTANYIGNFFSRFRKEKEKEKKKDYDTRELDRHRQEARKKLQEEHSKKAADYDERILQPRKLAKEKEKEEQFYRFLGPAWKGEGHKLGTSGEEVKVKKGSSKEAAAARVLPESPSVSVAAKLETKKKERKRIELPEEPEEGSPQTITIALKSPLGRVHRRRFLYKQNIQILIDYMITLGFHPKVYCICSTYPRQCLTDDGEKTLEDVGLTQDVALVIEEKDVEENE